ncbi:hypothetical protein OIE63_22420 [Streptomyces sp. NBC_01795]|nr:MULTISPECIES: hypothetical protein [unclassified Streptomyces]WSA97240.1 hypothetical protein OIE63_22420 [Streptomyces sp. NBC_01795]WSB81672.1 hypothetical protein OHB04_23550 [Streptomyces sp. NBC_01775]WSS17568.1 hypothetical protein OG533_16690 [Streptomyces sp. NBC_01186]WSS46315.1 hypothetical protein OG220_17250 [Streptomyces sp. NBC_01187]
MRLNHALPPDGANGKPTGGPNGKAADLVVQDDELGALGNMAYSLHQKLSTTGDLARQNTFDAATQLFNDGLDAGAALTTLHDAWNTKLGTIKEACAHISNHLDYTKAQHTKDEDDIQTGMKNAAGKAMTVSRIYDYIK